MDKKILASEIEKEIKAASTITAATKTKWADLEYEERSKILYDLEKKYKLENRSDNFDVYLRIGFSRNEIKAAINWKAIGSVSIEETTKFAKDLADAADALKKATDELKKQYPDIKIGSR